MFKDYYQILEVSYGTTASEIKSAYRKQALKWHPDKHQNMNVKSIMQDINEAYAILKDPDKRARYDQEYSFFKKTQVYQASNNGFKGKQNHQEYNQNSSDNFYEFRNKYKYDYEVKNEDLRDDIRNAQNYAKELVEQFFNELKRNSKLAAVGAWEGAKGYVYCLLILIFIGFVIKTCVS